MIIYYILNTDSDTFYAGGLEVSEYFTSIVSWLSFVLKRTSRRNFKMQQSPVDLNLCSEENLGRELT